MTTIVALAGIGPGGPNETRAIAHLDVTYNGEFYKWQVYIPENTTNIETFIQNVTPVIESQISSKEAQWASLNPKTRDIEDPLTGQITVVNIPKEEIVRPDIPDYYALRRNEYPPVTTQLDALWKGSGSTDYALLQNNILSVKQRYPNPSASTDPGLITESIVLMTQKRLDDFARTRNYDSILSACTYVGSPVLKFAQEAAYAVEARSLTWAKLYEMLGEVEAGTRPMPTGYNDIEAELPALQWPN